MRAEREKREQIYLSEGDKLARINRAEGNKQEAIKQSEGERLKRENEATGEAFAIEAVAKATAMSIREIAAAINEPGGQQAVQLSIAQDWIQSFAKLAKENNTLIIPTDVTDIASVTSVVKTAFESVKK